MPGEHSSGEGQHRLSITKAGNTHLRRLLTESANTYFHGVPGMKSKAIRERQNGMPPEIVAYADKAGTRLRKKYIRLASRSNSNIAKTAIAREPACFVWGMMNDRIA